MITGRLFKSRFIIIIRQFTTSMYICDNSGEKSEDLLITRVTCKVTRVTKHDDDDDCPLILRQKSSMHSMLVAQGRGDIKKISK